MGPLRLPSLGVSAVRLAMAAVNQLNRIKGRYASCTMCIGVGRGIALVLERVSRAPSRDVF